MPKVYLVCSELINDIRYIRLFLSYDEAQRTSYLISDRDFNDVKVETMSIKKKSKIGDNFVVLIHSPHKPYVGNGTKDFISSFIR